MLSAVPRSVPLLTAAVAFLVTLTAAALAWRSGFALSTFRYLDRHIESEVILVMVPLCALLLAIVVEVSRVVVSGNVPEAGVRRPPGPGRWIPGLREG